MSSQTNVEMIQILSISLIIIIIAIFALIGFLVYFNFKDKRPPKDKTATTKDSKGSNSVGAQNKQSIFNFMEFDNVEDNMILQKNGNRFLMVIGCQGVNYDLMSAVEKNSVEEGFVQFLNTLRHPIQIYIQTRSINLESSLQGYRKKVKEIEEKYQKMQMRYQQMVNSDDFSDEQLSRAYFELTKQSNLYEYGTSLIQDTERMSLNKNILNKNFYMIVPY